MIAPPTARANPNIPPLDDDAADGAAAASVLDVTGVEPEDEKSARSAVGEADDIEPKFCEPPLVAEDDALGDEAGLLILSVLSAFVKYNNNDDQRSESETTLDATNKKI